MTIRIKNGKGRKLSTERAIKVLEEHGVETSDGQVQPIKCLLVPTTINRWLRMVGSDHGRLMRAPQPEHRKVGSDTQLSMQGAQYEVAGDPAGG